MREQFPITDRALREMFEGKSTETGRARDTIRKSGFRPSSGGGDEGTILAIGPFDYQSGLAAGSHLHPRGLGEWTTCWDLTSARQISVTAAIIEADPGATLNAVWAPSWNDILVGDYDYLTEGVALGGPGFYSSAWATIPEEAKGSDAFVALVLDAESSVASLNFGAAEVKLRGSGGVSSGGSLTFNTEPPFFLVEEGGQFYADWSLVPGNFGYSDTDAGNLLQGWLHDPSGWSQAGITFRRVSGAAVTFQIVEGTRTVANIYSDHVNVEIGYDRIVAGNGLNVTTHEAGHAFFRAAHSGSGIMRGLSPDGYPTASDIQSVIDWLAS